MAFNHPSRLRNCQCGFVPAPALIIPIPNGGFAAPTWYIKLACTIQPYGVAQQVPEIEFKNPALEGDWYGRPPLSGLQPDNAAFDIPWGEDETRSVKASMTVNNRNPGGVVLELRDADTPTTVLWRAVNMTYFDGSGSCQMVCTIGDKSGGIKWLPYPCLRIPDFDVIATCLCNSGILLGAQVRFKFDPESVFSELSDRKLFLEPTGSLNIFAGMAGGGEGIFGGSGTCIATEVTASTTLDACDGPGRFIIWGEWTGSVAATGSYDSNQWFVVGVAYVCKVGIQDTFQNVALIAFSIGTGPDLSGAGKPCPQSAYSFDLTTVPPHPLNPLNLVRNDEVAASSVIDSFSIEFAELGGRANRPCNSACPGPSSWEIEALVAGQYRLPQWRMISSGCSGECFSYNCNARPPFLLENRWMTVVEFEELGYDEEVTHAGTCECAPEFVNPPAPPIPCDARVPNLTIVRELCDEVGPGLYLYRWAPITNPCGGSVACGSNPPCTWIPPFALPSYPIGDSEAEDWDGRDLPSLVGEEFEGTCDCVEAYEPPECTSNCEDCETAAEQKTFTIVGAGAPNDGEYLLLKGACESGECCWFGGNEGAAQVAEYYWSGGTWILNIGDHTYTTTAGICADPVTLSGGSGGGMPGTITVQNVV